MPLSIGVNLRVTGHCNQGGRKYMEDMFSVAYQQTPDDKDLEYAFFGIFDGHGGGEAATFAKEHLMDIIVKQKNFWSDRDEDVLRAIRDGYVNTHYAMWRELDKWPRTASGLPSTAGTTASIAFIRKGKIYIGHVGDSGIILGYQVEGDPQWRAKALTKDHKPESGAEMIRIQESGGKVVNKSGVPRVVWNRPRIGHKGPVRRSTHIDEIPFLAVARSLGDLWSYNSELDTFVVSPEPDVKVVTVDVKSHRCLIFGTDGLWNMITHQAAVAIVQAAERHNEKHLIASQQTGTGQADIQIWINPSKSLVDKALHRWSCARLRADNTSVVTLMLDPPGPSRSEVLLSQKKERMESPKSVVNPELSPIAKEHNYMEKHATLKIPSVAAIDNVDQKIPDSSNENLPDKIVSTNNTKNLEEPSLQIKESSAEVRAMQKVPENETSSTECIQVAEISSSDILDEFGDIDALLQKETETKNDKFHHSDNNIKELRELREKALVQIVQRVPKSELFADSKKEDNSVPSKLDRPKAFSENCEELQPSQFTNKLRRHGSSVMSKSGALNDFEQKNTYSSLRHKQHTLFSNSKDNIKTITRRHSLTTQQNLKTNSVSPILTVSSRFKTRSTRTSVIAGNKMEESIKHSVTKANTTIGIKRRHSSIAQAGAAGIQDVCILQEPCMKRRTRSDDHSNPTDENDPSNQSIEDPNSRLSWPKSDTSLTLSAGGSATISMQDRLSSPNIFQRRRLGKKATPVKTIRRPSINGSSRLQQLRGSFGLRDWDQKKNGRSNTCSDKRPNRTISIITPAESNATPQRWLRSDTMAATPVKTLRSRNVDITGHTISAQLVHQYGVIKQKRLSMPSRMKQSANNNDLISSRVRSSSMSSNKFKQGSNGNGNNTGNCCGLKRNR
ncbi:protein phosphatase 1D [Prorops nasuta]|uniref:protein phosphatase 1D n=1 Tax=Prorops nasuta TaxID=863751 RepID=UPI0034CE6ADB